MTNLLNEYVAGVAVLVTGWAGAQALKTLRRRRPPRPPAALPQIPVQDDGPPAPDGASE
ncbi:hypothetical protein [Streptomyces lydicamycinicus]|uniref:hypothetical protein n=1 Tax=Streptomyces lydicamycinicus TaxID=1546107 RepID=UPI003C2C8D7E